jgi:hypothetical protein
MPILQNQPESAHCKRIDSASLIPGAGTPPIQPFFSLIFKT